MPGLKGSAAALAGAPWLRAAVAAGAEGRVNSAVTWYPPSRGRMLSWSATRRTSHRPCPSGLGHGGGLCPAPVMESARDRASRASLSTHVRQVPASAPKTGLVSLARSWRRAKGGGLRRVRGGSRRGPAASGQGDACRPRLGRISPLRSGGHGTGGRSTHPFGKRIFGPNGLGAPPCIPSGLPEANPQAAGPARPQAGPPADLEDGPDTVPTGWMGLRLRSLHSPQFMTRGGFRAARIRYSMTRSPDGEAGGERSAAGESPRPPSRSAMLYIPSIA